MLSASPLFCAGGFENCEYSVGITYMWRDFLSSEIAYCGNTLIIKENFDKDKFSFLYPIGGEADREMVFTELENYCAANKADLEFSCIPPRMLPFFEKRYGDNMTATAKRMWSDYIYKTEEMAQFKGGKFSGQRNHINKFKKLYPDYVFRVATAADTQSLHSYMHEFRIKNDLKNVIGEDEFDNADIFLDDYLDFGMTCGIIEVGGKIVAFTIGERCGNTLFIHIEKALREYEGVYPTIVNEFAKLFPDVEFCNREDDAGEVGLRTSKLQYKPFTVADKYHLTIENKAARIGKLNELRAETPDGQQLFMSAITPSDGNLYAQLYLDEQLNRYWGYDYHTDISEPTPQAFVDMVEKDFDDRTAFSFAIRLTSGGDLIGEATVYDFSFDGSAELGIRISAPFQGKKYAKTALNRIICRLEETIQPTFLRAKCFTQNVASRALFISLGFTESEDTSDGYYHFEKRFGVQAD